MIYLDYAATTPVDRQVLDTFVNVTKNYIGNPNSLHKLGIDARELIDAATKQIANLLGVLPSEVIYTSGASEANNAAIKGVCSKYRNRGKHIITSKLEHSSITSTLSYLQSRGYDIDFVKTDSNGLIDLEDLKSLIRDDTILVTICSVNSEVGVIQPIEKIAKILKEYPKIYFHSDMTQSIGKVNIDISNVDMISFSAQKIYGLKGIGCLIKKESIVIDPIIHGGKSTTIYRSGTPAVGLITSFSKALRLAISNLSNNYKYISSLNTYLKDMINDDSIHLNSNKYCIPHILNISVIGIKPETLLHALEKEEIYISTQTACSSKSTSSVAVFEVTKNQEYSQYSIRISISHLTKKCELDIFYNTLVKKIKELKAINESH